MDPFAISIFDQDHSQQEDRWITTGQDGHKIVVIVVHTFQEVAFDEWVIRIISARKATRNEIKQYEDHEI